MNAPRGVALLGATGSIGRSALSVFEALPERFRVVSMSAGSNLDALLPAIARFRPTVVSVKERAAADRVRREFPGVRVGFAEQGMIDVATHPEAEVVLGAVVGAAGLPPAYEAVKLGKTLALANKEVLVVAGEAVMAAAAASGSAVLPVDSEHCALHQALRCGRPEEVDRLVLTASGGPFRKRPLETFDAITIEDALAHPTWKMGPKITIDSATMMNKGLEVIEARWLFDVPPERIGVVIHPQSIVHSFVEWIDGSVIAQISPNDMRFPILYALTYPERVPTPMPKLDLPSLGTLELAALDERRYPAVPLAYAALRAGGTAPAVLNAANEVAVAAFLEGRIPYRSLVPVVERVLADHPVSPATTLEAVLEADREARRRAAELVSSGAPLASPRTVAPASA
ncbi:MAG: 1-deoxy-D-xylulose-5-phosphate reductoisomerase [Thermoanaerobaculia bacterium]|jgi:1-deoxy-D-xylulose-5-phosphate reductoisomerase|nr:1-deoxy-D-xylulose-5-phosphate reductoisomerase [Thermoanaerobaculia bacterium]